MTFEVQMNSKSALLCIYQYCVLYLCSVLCMCLVQCNYVVAKLLLADLILSVIVKAWKMNILFYVKFQGTLSIILSSTTCILHYKSILL